MPQKITEETLLGDVIHEWTILEYEKHARGMLWYVLAAVLGLALVLYGVFTGNFLFSLIVILAAIILFLQSHQEPRQIPFQITDLGVIVGTRFYPYAEFENFYIVYNPPEVKTLFLDTKNTLQPILRIPLLDMNPIEVKHSLREYLSEDIEKEEPLTDRAARNWKIH
ncbi:MAG: hypothetical protein A2921_01705 [Candidatus Magasanikbacteria bacterium RIFCSPLOWO2_01_FULL_43_20b]|uniref:DUF5673 domain-containing protein n=1 Tax=Candidatus Magasanikbacteria bacterium RIFCSPLOWO2_12_FULL_43_12 TaxID=1798692 RepID=A0A1F6MVS4_9BACT|nr:MAG: hypothetical protein A3C74_04250 [Candidatus Magasanikbacteria bacterium RIFCSPHIGHO2_02_FULL_44_13]OGH71688.1 MAG: hypothetical protein A3I93_02270 [Candidatus Magasanikbacteria bacterium RIFCSPLOWO2_02_FULL_43_22]OGH73207.1 MAG: hypothetical protein A2921_01705 [Candidatus Magasanikbacteria bacterium RIFCSPLOWO2_01_FULL_43_20b]OGH75711.1 MAG: hypothetical protein A3G00_03130 [Candidatus Magasanikbacteria bacterium RIFCSPLOWO2_12_FULL_43_12]